MDKELASLHTYLFSLCVNAGAAQATSTGSRQLKLTRRSRLPAERYCQVERASTANRHKPAGSAGFISRPIIAASPTHSELCSRSQSSRMSQHIETELKKKIANNKGPDHFRFIRGGGSDRNLLYLTLKMTKHTKSCTVPLIKLC